MTSLRNGLTQQEVGLRSVADSHPHPHELCALPASLTAADGNAGDGVGDSMGAGECRICKGGAEEGKLVRACRCRGSCEYVHVACLERWLHCRPMPTATRHLLNANNSSAPARDAPHCEVCKAPYTVRIHHRSRFDAQRCCSARSCETYFECASLLVTLVMLIATPSFLWHASSPMERESILAHWPVVGLTALLMVVLSLLALRKMFCRWRRAQTTSLISIDA